MNIQANPVKLVRSFSDVQSDMSRMDGNLTQWEHHGRTYPGSNVDDRFRDMARDLDDATLSLSELHPREEVLLGELKDDTLNLAYNAGLTRAMNNHRSSFGSGWRNEMDEGIQNTREAIDLLTQEPDQSQDGVKQPPTPMQLMRQLSDVQSKLTRWDANFSQWESNGRTYPSSSVHKNVFKVAEDLYDARNAFRQLHPEQTDLLNNLQGDIIKVASDAGATKHMNNHRNNFGSGWGESLDRPIQSVRRAIDVLVASQS